MVKTEESGVSHAAVMVQANTTYRLISTDPSQAFSANLYTTKQRLRGYRYTKGVGICNAGELITLDCFDRKHKFLANSFIQSVYIYINVYI